MLPELHEGEHIRIQLGDKWKPGVVIGKHNQPKSYVVGTLEGRIYRCNRKHLRQTAEMDYQPALDQDGVNKETDCDDNMAVKRTGTHTFISTRKEH